MSALTFELPMPPNLANSRMHWRVKHRAKKDYWYACDMNDFGPNALVPMPTDPITRATISSVMYLGAAMDHDNAMARHKWALDWLVTRGYLADDRKKCLTWTGFPEQIIKRDGNYRLVLTLTEIPVIAHAPEAA